MKARICSRLFLPGILLLLVLLLACRQADVAPTPQTAPTLPATGQTSKPLTSSDQQAIADFTKQYETLEQEWVELRADFDGWRSGLTECHPSAAQDALSEFAASFKEVTEAARSLPRTTSTRELADLIIPSVESEETAFRTLRDRWLPGNASFLESVEQRRTAASNARKATEDRALELQQEFEEGPTANEVEEAENFSKVFKQIEDAWEEYHDDYRNLRNSEGKLELDEVISRYNSLAETLSAVVESLAGLESTEILQDLIDTLDDAADDEFDALTALLEALEEGIADPAVAPEGDTEERTAEPTAAMTGGTAQPVAPPAQAPGEGVPAPGEGAGQVPSPPGAGEGQGPSASEAEGQAPDPGTGTAQAPTAAAVSGQRAVPGDLPPATPTMEANGSEPSIFHIELDNAYKASIIALEEVSAGIEEIVEDRSAEYLVGVMDFNRAYKNLLTKWQSFHDDYDSWREKGGGCDRISTLEELDGFRQEATSLAAKVRVLPRTGYLLPVYALVVDAADQEAGAMRALYNSWRPFAVDAFAAVEQERTNADRLRQQAMTGLQELTARP